MSKCIVKILRDETPGIGGENQQGIRRKHTVMGHGNGYQIPGGSNSDYERERNSRV